MKLWKISQNVNNDWDTYDSAVVAAEMEEDARKTHPGCFNNKWYSPDDPYTNWAFSPEQVTVEYLGEAKPGTEAGVILASFNVG